MRIAKGLLPCIIGLALSGGANAQIYQSKDAQGNTVFTDKPSAGAEAVKLPTTNSADPVVATPRPTEAAEPPAPKKVATRPTKPVQRAQDVDDDRLHDDYYYDGYNYNGNNDDDDNPRENRRRRMDSDDRPGGDRPQVSPHRTVTRPAAGGGGGRR